MDRVIAYVDGFNLYYGLRAKGWRRLYWLDVHRLAENLLKPGQRLVRVHYFTARITSRPGDEGTRTRQSTYLDALETLDGVRLHYGHYLAKTRQCPRCRATWETFEEKMTDVNIAVELLGDARDDAFDTAVVVSGDSDLTKPVQAVQMRDPTKRVVVACPPERTSVQLREAAAAGFVIGRKKLQDSQLPHRVVTTGCGRRRGSFRWRRAECRVPGEIAWSSRIVSTLKPVARFNYRGRQPAALPQSRRRQSAAISPRRDYHRR